VKHSLPKIVPELPANLWHLSDEGRLRCKTLAERLSIRRPDVIVTSLEPKAAETGKIVANILGKPFETAEGLHEHDRSNVGFSKSKGQFEAQVALFFENPASLVLGKETADETHRRFSKAVASVVERHPSGNIAIVAHGTVITLLVTRTTGLQPFPFWRGLGLPSFVVLSLPEFELLAVVEDV
jgi:broad specificity phosphatase PhoE